jgi:hypothetical protein
MNSTNSTARTLGLLLLAHLIVGLTAPFMMLHAVTASRGFLLTAAENAMQVRIAVFLLTVGSAMAIAISVTAFPIFRRHSSAMAIWLLALAVAGFALQSVDNGRLLAMLSLSQEYVSAGALKTELFQMLAIVVGSARKWAHYTYLLVAVSWIFMLFLVLFRFRLVPRALAIVGLVCTALQIAGVTLRAMMGYPPETRLAMPLAPAYVGLAIWLIIKGFNELQHGDATKPTEVRVAEIL